MKTQIKFVITTSAFVLWALFLLRPNGKVGAAGISQISGTIKLEGQAPRQRPIDVSKDPSCSRSSPLLTENVVVGGNGGLANVVVYISQGLTGNEPVATQPVRMEQKGCQYVPHVVALNVGQHLTVLNDDQTLHNIHPDPRAGGGNMPFNKSQISGGAPIDVTWPVPEVAIPVKCNVHPWMHGYIAVVKGPLSVSNEDGTFKLENVAAGTYTLTAWHETLGTQTQTITVATGKPARVDFTFKAK
jgi:plastocyanin